MSASETAAPTGALPKAHCVTGAFGFSGQYLTRRLLNEGRRVVTLTSSPDRPNPFGGRVAVRPYAFRNVDAMARALAGVEVLYITYWVRFNHDTFTHVEAVRNTLALFEAAQKAGVERVVYVSITNADPHSQLEYFSAKGHLEDALKASKLCWSIVRPAVLFGKEDILINNIAWGLRRFPLFPLFGDGSYRLQPIHVDDLAALMIEQGKSRENETVNALGPEAFTYRDMVAMLGESIGKKRRLLSVPPALALRGARMLGVLVGDRIITEEEITGLMDGLLHVPGARPTGATRLSLWAVKHAATLGKQYHSELDRRINRDAAY